MAIKDLYIYKRTYKLTISNNGQRMEGPMYNDTIKIHKGIDDKITFNVYDDARRLAALGGLTLSVNIIDANTGALVLRKDPIVRDEVKGTFDVIFSWGDTTNLDAGFYEYSVTVTDTNGDDSMLYTDLAQGATGTIELTDSILPSPAKSLEVTSFVLNGLRYESNAVTAAPNRGYQSSLHTCAIYLTDYTGKVYAEGSHDLTSPTNWFVIDLHTDNSLVEYNNYATKTGIDPFNFNITTNWFRFVHVPDASNTGTIDKILIRS